MTETANPGSATEIPASSGAYETQEGATAVPLSFAELNRRLSAIPDYDAPSPGARSKKWPRVCQLVSLVAYAALILVACLSPDGTIKVVLMLLLLAIEIASVMANIWLSRGELVSLIKPFEDFARQLDHDFPYHFEIRDWLASQPRATLEKYAAMSKYRRERYAQKLPLLAGSVSTLGIVPVLVAVYFQGHQIIDGHAISWIDWIFGFFLLLFYWLTWTSSLTKTRLEAMDMYLQDALTKPEAPDPVATTK